MASIAASAALTVPEHRALDRLVASLERELGDHLHAVWLYGSRARGEWREESDIDVLVIASVPREIEKRVDSLVETAAESEGSTAAGSRSFCTRRSGSRIEGRSRLGSSKRSTGTRSCCGGAKSTRLRSSVHVWRTDR